MRSLMSHPDLPSTAPTGFPRTFPGPSCEGHWFTPPKITEFVPKQRTILNPTPTMTFPGGVFVFRGIVSNDTSIKGSIISNGTSTSSKNKKNLHSLIPKYLQRKGSPKNNPSKKPSLPMKVPKEIFAENLEPLPNQLIPCNVPWRSRRSHRASNRGFFGWLDWVRSKVCCSWFLRR